MNQTKGKKSKRIISIITFLVIFAIPVFSMGVSANNHTDTDWSYTIASYQTTWTDAARYKEDMSSSYQKCISSADSYTSWVYGSYDTSPNYAQCMGNLKDPNDSNRGTPYYTFSTGTTHYMQNWVRENGVPYAGMLFMGGKGYSFTTHIKWSPDSV